MWMTASRGRGVVHLCDARSIRSDPMVYRIYLAVLRSVYSDGPVFYFYFFICLLTMCRALFIQNEKADVIHRIPPTSSNRFSFPACTPLNMHPHHLPRYLTYYVSIRHASYSASTFHPHAMGNSPPSSSLLPLAAWRSRRASL